MNRFVKILSFISLTIAIMSSLILLGFLSTQLGIGGDSTELGFRLYIIIIVLADILLTIPFLIITITKKFKNIKFYLLCHGYLIIVTILSIVASFTLE